jgi:hypothetical protein
MNRRGILALLGGAVAMPTVGAKAAASALYGWAIRRVKPWRGGAIASARPAAKGWIMAKDENRRSSIPISCMSKAREK